MKLFAVLGGILAAMFSSTAVATTIIVVREPAFFAFAADSKETFADKPITKSVCKIHSANNIYWAFAGLAYSRGKVEFSADDIAAAEMSASGGFDDRVNAFARDLAPKLGQALMYAKGKLSPQVFDRDFLQVDPLRIAFGTFENGIAQVRGVDFSLKAKDGTLAITTTTYSPAFVAIGWGQEIVAEIHKHPQKLRRLESIKHVAELVPLVELEDRAQSQVDGPPTALVAVSASGPQWIERGAC